MTNGRWFWWLLTAACVVWYSTVTVYVAVKGFMDIQDMLRRLSDKKTENDTRAGSDD